MARTVAGRKHQHDSNGVIHASGRDNESVIKRYNRYLLANKKSDQLIRNRIPLLKRLADHLHPTTLLDADYIELLDWQTSIRHLSDSSVAGYVSGVRVFYRWTVQPMHLLGASPAEELILPKIPEYKPRPVPASDFEIALLGCADDQTRMWLKLARYAGLRCMEIAQLDRDDILKEPPRLHIIGKGKRARIVFISVELYDDLRVWCARPGPMFRCRNGRPVTAKDVSTSMSAFFAAHGLPYTMHQVRHLYGTDALHRTKNARVVQSQLGHRSLATTQVYTEVNEDEAIELAAELGADLRAKNRRIA